MGEECCLSFISFLDLDVVVTPVDVYSCELGAPTEAVYDLGNEGGYIFILLCPLVDGLVVLYWS